MDMLKTENWTDLSQSVAQWRICNSNWTQRVKANTWKRGEGSAFLSERQIEFELFKIV